MEGKENEAFPHLYPNSPSHSFWQQSPQFYDFRSSSTIPTSAGIVIIGGGLTGIGVAYWLWKNGVQNLLLLESRGICSGATGRNGGILSPHYLFEEHEIGHSFEYDTISLIKQTVETHKIDCELFFNGLVRGAQNFEEDSRLQTSKGEYWDQAKVKQELKSDMFIGGLFRPEGGQIHPAKFVWGLTKILIENNAVNIQTQTTVTSITKNKDTILINTNRGSSIEAQKVIYATNAYSAGILPQLSNFLFPVKGQVISTKEKQFTNQPKFNITWNSGNEYLICRENDSRIIFGGFEWMIGKENQNYDDRNLDKEISKQINDFLPEIPRYKNLETQFEWVGIQAFTKDDLPLVGPLNEMEFIAAGYNGHGMAQAFGAAKMIAECIAGKVVNWIPQFLPNRIHTSN